MNWKNEKRIKMKKAVIEHHKRNIDRMSQIDMAYMWRFHEGYHIYFDNTNPLSEYFSESFKKKGGMTSEISKQIGWGERK